MSKSMDKKYMLDLLINAWYFRLMPYTDLDNSGVEIPAMTYEDWKISVINDIEKHLLGTVEQKKQEVEKEVKEW